MSSQGRQNSFPNRTFFSSKNFVILSVLVVVGVLLGFSSLDLWTSLLLSEEQTARYYQVFRKLTDIGESTHYFVISILSYSVGWLGLRYFSGSPLLRLRLQKAKNWGACFVISLLASGVVVHLIKFLVGRQRPHLTEGREAFIFAPLNIDWHFHSFPSGHSQTLMTAAVAFAFLVPQKRTWFYVVAVVLASTRIWLHQHFFSDVVLGLYIGYIVTLALFLRYYRFSK